MNKKDRAERILEQVILVRDTGATNMFDTNRVIEIAKMYNLNLLADFVSKHKKEYCDLIFDGNIEHIKKCL